MENTIEMNYIIKQLDYIIWLKNAMKDIELRAYVNGYFCFKTGKKTLGKSHQGSLK